MENLQLQQVCFENIKTLCTNYKKDSISRKTLEYLEKRLQSLEDQWKDFDIRHQRLLTEVEDKTIKYFAEDVYGNTNAMCASTKSDILSHIFRLKRSAEEIKFDLTGMYGEDAEDYLKRLLKRQECNFKAMDRALSKIDLKDVSEKWELEDHLAILKSKWDAVEKIHLELESSPNGTNDEYYALYVNMEDKYDQMRRKLNGKIWTTAHYQQSAPKVQIPDFSGSYKQWVSFKDLFTETIHNNPTINKAQKMQHLKTKLKGEAERLVQHLTVSAENYQSCWEILIQRYDNLRLQFTSFMNTMLNLPVIQHPDASNLKRMHDVITECLNGLSNIQVDTTSWGPMIVHLMSQKLDTLTYTEYMKELQDHRELPNLNEFLLFIKGKFMAYESMRTPRKDAITTPKSTFIKPLNKNISRDNKNYDFKKNFTKTYHSQATYNYGQCPNCNGSHVLMHCSKFLEMEPTQRNATVTELRVCKNCLYNHGNNECKSIKVCKECNMKHHTLLHVSRKQTTNNEGQQPSSNHLSNHEMEILLTTVQIRVKNYNGTYITLRALLDQGSQVNLITENAAQLLKLPKRKLNATVSGIGSVSGDCKGSLLLNCTSIYSNYTFEAQVLVMKKLTNNLPNCTFDKTNWPHLENLKLADPDYNISRPVDILLGAEVYSSILLEGVLRGQPSTPIAQQTHLGWILCGKLKTLNCHATLIDLSELAKFWEHEDISKQDYDANQDDLCEENFVKTVQRGDDGKYIVTMPLVPNFQEKLGNSKSIAISQFLQLEKRLNKNHKLGLMYREFMKEYIELQHMKPAATKDLTTNLATGCYLPHHGVLREQSTTTKLRVVFNASQKTASGYSLNSVLEKGPNLQKDIQGLILKWRFYRYAFTADIEKMYRCIWITEEQQHLQKIIWRESPTEKLSEFNLSTVTYGTKCAPWLAMRTLKQLAIDDGHKYPEAAQILQNEFYVDDLISGHNSLDKAKELQISLITLLKGGGMNLRKWTANDPALIDHLHPDQISSTGLFDFKADDSTQTLGLGWNPSRDTFTFNWNLDVNTKHRMTKRNLLSQISKLYDPLGWIAPITVTAKLLFQRVWASKLAWDEELPGDILSDWLKLKTELPLIKTLKLTRWVGGSQRIKLLGFCDASERAYACVIYSLVINENNTPIITLLVAKTRVAPLSQETTLPRLELCGALLLSRLMERVNLALTDYDVSIRAWCDSQVVLAWLQGDSSRWDRYVANRVNQIKHVIPAKDWTYIRSEMNPADCASRGVLPAKLLNYDLWWRGPEFLKTMQEENEEPTLSCLFTTNVEVVTTLHEKIDDNFINELLNNYSSLIRVTRVVAWIRRFVFNSRNKKKHDTNYLSANELIVAKEQIIKYVQAKEFATEYKLLMKNEQVPKNSTIYKLSPYIDSNHMIRVGGRLRNSQLPMDTKNPVVLPSKGRLTELLIQDAHWATLHGGARLTLSYLRQRYWIVGGNRAVKTQLRRCVRCQRFKPQNNHQLMGDLPEQRITPSRPFTHTGVDYTGWVDVKLNKGRGVKTTKGYIAIFVCMATKAVHIELVSDLSTEAFIGAFQRLCARRGTPKHVYSDCGTNFIGAAKTLRNEFNTFRQELSSEFFSEIGKLEVEWHFNAPAWPSAGGLWEAAVKAMKYHLHRVLGDQKLTFEEFFTLLSKIEACMNSRPLCPLTEDPEEFYNCLTPGHFLTGSPTMTLPISDISDVRQIDIRRRWQLVQHMLQQFWKNWSNEYLTQLQSRCKWNKPTTNLKEGDVVLVKDKNLPPGKWAMGRILEVHPGSDGLVRVTTLKTQSGTIKRPVIKLSPLPVEIDEQLKNDVSTCKAPAKHTSRRKKTRKNCFSTLCMALLMMFMFITGTYGNIVTSTAHITELEPERLIYYDTIGNIQMIHDGWTLLMYYKQASRKASEETSDRRGAPTESDSPAPTRQHRRDNSRIASHLTSTNNSLLCNGDSSLSSFYFPFLLGCQHVRSQHRTYRTLTLLTPRPT